jgi:hypothetical protein
MLAALSGLAAETSRRAAQTLSKFFAVSGGLGNGGSWKPSEASITSRNVGSTLPALSVCLAMWPSYQPPSGFVSSGT